MEYFHKIVLQPNRGAVITSATLHDTNPQWINIHTGIRHLKSPPLISTHKSPFDYKNNSKVICITDVKKNDIQQLAGAYIALFGASQGGGLGLFTSIKRLQQVGKIMHPQLAQKGFDMYAQHINHINTPTLIDIFKQDKNNCLLGTDAVRDGVDITGENLRLLVLERMPWAIPDILNTMRHTHFHDIQYKESLVRMKLQQAFGRLIRTKTDRGVFVCLEKIPSHFTCAFPEDTEILHCDLQHACDVIKYFMANT